MHDDDAPDQYDAPDDQYEAQDGWEETDQEEGRWYDEGRPWLLVAIAMVSTFALGVVASLLVVVTWTNVTDDEESSAESASLAGGSQLPDEGLVDSAADDWVAETAQPARSASTRLSRCKRAAKALDGPLAAARPALDQWGVHIGAMNKLVVGEITLQQAAAFWDSTRVGAQRRVGAFRDAMKVLRKRGLDCPSSAMLAPGARRLPGCARQVEAETRVLRDAGRSIDMWEHHVHQMDMLKRGELTPEEATRSWLAMWQQGARELDAYRTSASKAKSLDGCPVASDG